jgi:hypothetical protein
MARVAKALGLEGADKAKLDEKLAALEKERASGTPVSERLEARVRELEEERGKWAVERERFKTELNRSRRDAEKEQRKRADMEVEHELREHAAKLGIRDTDYALHLFGSHIRQNGDSEVDPAKFFESLKSNSAYRYLFNEEAVAAGPRPGVPAAVQGVGASVPAGAPAAASPGATPPPPPAPPGKAQAAEVSDVMDMKAHDFKRRTADKYGFRPGM